MKWIRYKLADGVTEKGITYSDRNLEIAISEAFEGLYTIEEDDTPELVESPTWQDRIEAQVIYNSMMLGTLIEAE